MTLSDEGAVVHGGSLMGVASCQGLPQCEAKDDPRVVISNPSASLLDIGDGVACLVFHSKMNTINDGITKLLRQTLVTTSGRFDALVIANDGKNFSAGADIRDFLAAIRSKNWAQIDHMEVEFQSLMQDLKTAPLPIVACPVGLTLGAGCEISLHASLRVAGVDTHAGLVEVGVGLFPAGGGTKELALRAYEQARDEQSDPLPFLQRAFHTIAAAKTSSSAQEAIAMGLYPERGTQVVPVRAQVLQQAKQAALALIPGFVPKRPLAAIRVVGDPGIQAFKADLDQRVQAGTISLYDAYIGERIATVLCGGAVAAGSIVAEQALLDLERHLFVELCQQPKTQERLEFMLHHGKRLRN